MRYQYRYQIILILIANTNCDTHNSKNDSDVIVTYAGHAEANLNVPILNPKPEGPKTEEVPTLEPIPKPEPKPRHGDSHGFNIMVPESLIKTTTEYLSESETEDVVFIPNEREVVRNEFDMDPETVKIRDLLIGKTVGDVMGDKRIRVETAASPDKDILFITGKNRENVEKLEPNKHTHWKSNKTKAHIKMNCTNLDCNNTLKSICGGKIENNFWKFRLFLNECYFNKVNCAFKYEINRYKQLPPEKCKNIGTHFSERPFVFKPKPLPVMEKPNITQTRRDFSSRRSLNLELNGQFCSHACPLSCPDDYEPECAVSVTGQRRVFVNHCSLDYNSCFYKIVWRRRPLADCVGSKKADVTQNRGFINWMQRIGIIDRKGRLAVE